MLWMLPENERQSGRHDFSTMLPMPQSCQELLFHFHYPHDQFNLFLRQFLAATVLAMLGCVIRQLA